MDEWQLDRMRRALRLLAKGIPKRYQKIHENEKICVSNDVWINLSEAIEELTGVSMGSKDRLRQFACGRPDSKKGGGWYFPTMGNRKIIAIKKFLTDENDPWAPLQEADLENFLPESKLPINFLEYIFSDTEKTDNNSSFLIEGIFVAEYSNEYENSLYHLTIEKFSKKDGIAQAFLVQEMRDGEKKIFPDNNNRYKGWLIVSPDNAIWLFLKSEFQKSNNFLSFVSIDSEFLTGQCGNRFSVSWYDLSEISTSAFDLVSDSQFAEESALKVSENILIFNRVSKHNLPL